MLADERQAHVDAYDGPIHPALFSRTDRHTWLDGGKY
jgi:hypothetical protein